MNNYGNQNYSHSKRIKVSLKDLIKPDDQTRAYVQWARDHGVKRVSVYNTGTGKTADACTGAVCSQYAEWDGEINMLSEEDSRG